VVFCLTNNPSIIQSFNFNIMTFKILTIFPQIFDSYFNESIIKRAKDKKIINFKIFNLRDFSSDRHKHVDDKPYGGGAGMVMMIEPLAKALKKIAPKKNSQRRIILLSASGQKFTQAKAKKLSTYQELVFVCGRYEGVDARIKKLIDEEISVGDYVLTGGELPAMTIVDAVSRLLPGVLGNPESLKNESHNQIGILEYPQYTKPEVFKINNKNYLVPKILLSGHHQKISEWRIKQQKANK
jgi:tRNA (guanine37-N1)-methyltransferase